MNFSWFDNAVWIVGTVGYVILLGVFIWRGRFRSFPVFTAYVVFGILTTPLLVLSQGSKSLYFTAYYAMLIPGALLELGVLLEIGANVVRPVRRSLPAGVLWLLGALILSGGLAGLGLALYARPRTLDLLFSSFLRVSFGIAVLRLLIFAAIAGFAQLLGIGWRNYVLQLATGLAFYGTVSIGVELYFVNFGVTPIYGFLSQLNNVSYLATQVYWIWSFSRQEAARKEFSPQMANFLVSLSGNVKVIREGLHSQGGRQQ
jgi:hypothetical protein